MNARQDVVIIGGGAAGLTAKYNGRILASRAASIARVAEQAFRVALDDGTEILTRAI